MSAAVRACTRWNVFGSGRHSASAAKIAAVAMSSPCPKLRFSGKVIATADLCDAHHQSGLLQVAHSNDFRTYGQKKSFAGTISTIKCFENNPLVKAALSEAGEGRILVVDGGGSLQRALLGDNVAALAIKNKWEGVILNGAIRDSEQIDSMPIGVRALGTNPIKSGKDVSGEKDVQVSFAGITFSPGHWVCADQDGIVVSKKALEG